MKIDKIQKRLDVEAAYWSEVPLFLERGFVAEFLRTEPFKNEPRFFCILTHAETKKRCTIIKRGTDRVEPDMIDPINALLAIATFSDAAFLTLPTEAGVTPSKTVIAVLHCKSPKPDLKWTVETDGKFYMGERKPMAVSSISAAIGNACEMGATEVHVPIDEPLRRYFKARAFRLRAIEDALAPSKIKIYTWSKGLGYPTNRFEKVVNRGDKHPEMRSAIIELTGLPEDKLWPEINWDT